VYNTFKILKILLLPSRGSILNFFGFPEAEKTSISDRHWFFNADPDPAFYLNEDPSVSRSWSDLLEFNMKNILLLSNSIKHTCVGKEAILKGWKSGLFVNFCKISLLLDPNPDPDP
jgi:hypothetical protein